MSTKIFVSKDMFLRKKYGVVTAYRRNKKREKTYKKSPRIPLVLTSG